MDNLINCIAKRLREARLAVGISQRRLGILAGIDEQSASARMNQYEMGKHIPNFLTLQHIGKTLGYPTAFFYSDDDMIAEFIQLLGKLSETDRKKLLKMVKNFVENSEQNIATLEEHT